MSILDKASLVITPTAYKEDRLYAIKPGTFGNELVTNGDFSSTWATQGFSYVPSGWTKSGADDINNYVTQNGGSARIVSGPNNNVYFSKVNILTVGKRYKLKFDVIALSGGTNILISDGGVAVNYLSVTSTGTFTTYFTATNDGWVVFGKNNSTQSIDFTIDNVSVVEDLTGDLTWTRTTDATRINKDGYVERVPWNLMTYSEQIDNAAWSKVQSTISSNATLSPFGSLTADKIISNSFTGRISCGQAPVSISSGNTYTVSVYLKAAEWSVATMFIDQTQVTEGAYWGSGVNLNLTAGTSSHSYVTLTPYNDGWYLATIKCTPTINSISVKICPKNSTLVDVNNIVGDGTSGIYVWGAQVVEGSNSKPYFPTTDRLNVPRINYPTTGGTPSILIEPQRTNIFGRSEDFSDLAWTLTNATVTSNYSISPSGIINADKLVEDTANGVHRFFGSTGTAVSGNTYTMSIYAKPEERVIFEIDMRLSTPGQYSYLYNLTALTTSQVGTSSAATTIEDVGNGWYRCSITAMATATTATLIVYLHNSSSISYTGISGYGMGFWGLQFESGSYPTSYIPTTTAAVTRNTDTFARSNVYTNGLISASGGSWFIEFENNIQLTRDASGAIGLILGDTALGTGNSLFISRTNAVNSRVVIRKFIAGVATEIYTTLTDTVKVLISWNGSTADVFVNGVKVTTDTTFTATALEFLNMTAPLHPYNISSMVLFPIPISDAEAIQLTTL